jgi:DNA-binding sugar fermentation-stimulating protein
MNNLNKNNFFLLFTIAVLPLFVFFITLLKEKENNKISSLQAQIVKKNEQALIANEEKQIIKTQLFTQPAEVEKKLTTIKTYLPENATVTINGKKTYSLGQYRIYESELPVGKSYKFVIGVSYASGYTEIKEVSLSAGQSIELNFN